MIPRYQRVLFWILAGASLIMALVLLRGCEQEHRRLSAHPDTAPIASPPADKATQEVTLLVANDFEGSITPAEAQIPLPKESTTRARALLNHLLASYSQAGSTHLLPALPAAPAVDDVFLLEPASAASPPHPAHGRTGASAPDNASVADQTSGQTAVVNLHQDFVEHHPSGVETETLTLQSIVGTLHANFPDITQVRFLVGGQPREALAGHADLLRPYPVSDTSFQPTTPIEDDARP